jgi:hypothetical protein
MKNYTLLIGTAALSGLVAVSAPVMAQGYGSDAGANASTQGSVNSNGVNTTDRDLGQDRARERASENSRLNRTETARRSGAADPTYSAPPAADSANPNAAEHSSEHSRMNRDSSTTPPASAPPASQ